MSADATSGHGVGWAILAVLLFCTAGAGFAQAFHGIDTTKLCHPRGPHPCMWRLPARVVSVDRGDQSFKAVGEDGTHKLSLEPGEDLPDVGTRVTLERWDTYWVSYVDVRRGRRMHTEDWSTESSTFGLVMGCVLAALGLIALAMPAKSLFSRMRQSHTAPSTS